jgi:hypothetical protein
MKKQFILIFFILSLFIVSCTSVLKLVYGVKKPKPRSIEYLKRQARKYSINQLPIYTISQEDLMPLFKKMQKLGIGTSVNNVIIFDKKGSLIIPNFNKTCSSQSAVFFSNYMDNGKIVDSVHFEDLFGISLKHLENNVAYEPDSNKTIFVITWASYAGRLNKYNSSFWADSIIEIMNSNEQEAIYLDLDLVEN